MIPARPEEIDPVWLTEALRSGGILGDARVTHLRREPIGDVASFNAQIVRLSVELDRDEADVPRGMIVKLPTADEAVAEVGEHFRPNETEIRFYRDVAPAIALRVPRCYHSAMDPGASVLVLEDLAPARVLDQAAGCSVEQAELALGNLAALHADWWESPRLTSLDWLASPGGGDGELVDLIGRNYARAWCRFVGLVDEMPGAARRFGEALPAEMGRVFSSLEGSPRTLAHGDFRLANVMFGTPENTPFAVIDWEDVFVGRGVVDVAWFVVGCLAAEDRRAHERSLVEGYHRALIDRGVVPGYAFEALWEDYRTALLERFVQAVLMATSPGVFTRQREFGRALAERFVTASEDHRLIELLRH